MFEILDIDASSLTDGEQAALLRSSAVERNRLDAAECRLLADWDARQIWAADGALSGAAWLRNQLGCSMSSARDRLRVARRLRHMPLTAAAFAAGDLSLEKVRLLAGLRSDVTAEAFDTHEGFLVDDARRFDTGELAKITRYWKAAADAAGFAGDTNTQHDAQQAFLSKTLAGMYKLDGSFCPEDGQVLEGELDQIMDDLHRQERRDQQNGVDIPMRTAAQRRAAAIIEMARRSATTKTGTGTGSASGRRPRPEVGIVLPLDTLLGGDTPARYADGTPLTAETARRLACDADLFRIITGTRSEILDLGRQTPDPNRAQRRAVTLRDIGCTFAGCDMPSTRCEVHHLDPYARRSATGGPTDLHNLTLVCSRHHHLIHEGDFTLRRDPDTGHIETHRPDGTPILTRPRAGPLTPHPATPDPRGPANPRGTTPGTGQLDLDAETRARAPERKEDQRDLDVAPDHHTPDQPTPEREPGDADADAATGSRSADHDSDRSDHDPVVSRCDSDDTDPEQDAGPPDSLRRPDLVRDDLDDGPRSQAS